jgi:hypothetical protein
LSRRKPPATVCGRAAGYPSAKHYKKEKSWQIPTANCSLPRASWGW